LVEKISLLIEDARLRRAMGHAARWEVEQGKFSIRSRNEKLKQIFDEVAT
jgi:glycosyltransferase involved in cell wall biosynthesis